jgi:hypothetical protein
MNSRALRFSFILFVLFLDQLSISADAGTAFLDRSAIVRSWESNYYYQIKNAEIVYSRHLVKENYADIDTDKLPIKVDFNAVVRDYYEARISDYNSNKFYAETATSMEGFEDRNSRLMYAFDGKNTTSYVPTDNLGVIRPGLLGRGVEGEDNIKPLMLLTTLKIKALADKYPDGIPKFSRIFDRSRVKVGDSIEVVSGQPCHVMELDINEPGHSTFRHKVWVAHNKGMLPMKYEEFINGQLREKIEVEEIDSVETDTGTIWFPTIAYRTLQGKIFGLTTCKFVTKSYKPNITVNEGTFRVTFPPGARIIDKVQNLEYETVGREVDSLPSFHAIETNTSKEEERRQNTSLETNTETAVSESVVIEKESNVQNADDHITPNPASTSASKWPITITIMCVLMVVGAGFVAVKNRGGKSR